MNNTTYTLEVYAIESHENTIPKTSNHLMATCSFSDVAVELLEQITSDFKDAVSYYTKTPKSSLRVKLLRTEQLDID